MADFIFSQDEETLELHYEVKDAEGNVLTPDSPQFSLSSVELAEIQSHTASNVVLVHTDRHNTGFVTVSYSVVKDGERIFKNSEVQIILGSPASITVEQVEN